MFSKVFALVAFGSSSDSSLWSTVVVPKNAPAYRALDRKITDIMAAVS
jgi:hypothetical protein